MLAYRGFLCLSVLLLLALRGIAPPARATEPGLALKQGPRVDEVGDPLPQGAVARIGTVRLRQPSEVCSVAYSPDGKLVATGGRYDGVRLWDATTGKALRFLPAQGGQGIFYLSFSPDGKSLVSSGTDGALEVWNVATGNKSRQLGEKSISLGPLCFSDDGKLLAVADRKTMRVWETAGWTERKLPSSDGKEILLASFAGKRMFVRDKGLGDAWKGDSLWNLISLEKRAVPAGWLTGYGTVLSPDGKQIAVSGWTDTFVLLRDVATGKQSHRLVLAGKKDATVTSLCYSPDGKLLAIGGRGIQMRCIDADTGKETARFGDQKVDYAYQLAFSPDGKRLAAAHGNAIRLWEVGTGKELLFTSELLQSVQAIAFSPNGKQLIFGDGDWLRLYDVATRKQVWRCPEQADSGHRIAFAPDGKTFVTGNVSRLRFHDTVTAKMTHSWGKGLGSVHRIGEPIELDLFTPDLERVVSLHVAAFGDPNKDVFVRSAKTGKELLKFQRRGESATAACISPNGQFLAIGDWKAPIQLYNLTSGKWVTQLEATGTHWHTLVYAPDGRTLASMDPKGSLQLLEVATGKTRLVLPGAEARDQFVFSPDGKVLANWGNKTVELLDTLTGRKLGRLAGHAGRITQAAFVPGGSMLATASEDTTILLWDVADLVRSEKPKTLTPDALNSAWKDLADPNAAKACRAMASLRQTGLQAVDFLRERLRPQQMPDAKQIDRWLKDLDHAEFAVRKVATQELEKYVDVLVPTLRKALAAGPSLESNRRLAQLIDMAEGRWAPEALRTLRAIELLEHVGSTEARTVLETLAGGAPAGRLTREAKASMARLAK